MRSGLASVAARRIYSDIGRIIGERSFDVSLGRAYTSRIRKLVLVGYAVGDVLLSIPRRIYLKLSGRGDFKPPHAILTFDAMTEEQRA